MMMVFSWFSLCQFYFLCFFCSLQITHTHTQSDWKLLPWQTRKLCIYFILFWNCTMGKSEWIRRWNLSIFNLNNILIFTTKKEGRRKLLSLFQRHNASPKRPLFQHFFHKLYLMEVNVWKKKRTHEQQKCAITFFLLLLLLF